MLPMPPRFWSPRHSDGDEKSIESAMGTSGAPCPPAATSRTLKSLMTSIPVRSAITAASPDCQVECPGSCQIVCPCDAIAAMSSRATPASAITCTAASPSQPPRSKLSRQYSAGVPPPRAALKRVRSLLVYGRERYARSSTSIRPSLASRKRATAALIPSSEVPDIKPTTTPDDILSLSDRWRSVPGHATNNAAIFGEKFQRFLARNVFLLHDDRELDALVSPLQQFCRFIARHSANFHHDALAPIDQFVVGGAKIDHQIAVGFAEPDHGAGGDRVEHQFRCGACLHACRSSHHFGADDRQHGHIHSGDEVGGWGRAGDDASAGAERGSSLQGGAHVWRGA